MNQKIELEQQYCANNYAPLPVVLTRGEGIYVWDDNGKRYIDMMSAYSAVSHGHCHPRLVAALHHQAKNLGIVSRAYHSDQLGSFLKYICELSGYQKGLPMNSGAEAVETALKAARKWGYQIKKIPENNAEVIVCQGNFHGRTIAIVGMSSEPQYQHGFGPFAPGFKMIPYGDAEALEAAITDNTAAFLVEPIQGEAGIIVPPVGYLKKCREICDRHNVLLICDEIQSGLGRTGKLFAFQHDNIRPDGLILGKALGGGLLPVSIFLADDEVMQVFTPGDHGSTFGGYSIAAAVAKEALEIIVNDKYAENSHQLGEYMQKELQGLTNKAIKEVRGQGLFIGIDIDPNIISARAICLKMMERGLLSKDTHHTVIRLAPPLVITREQIDDALEIICGVFKEIP